jgi:hypothetical protein
MTMTHEVKVTMAFLNRSGTTAGIVAGLAIGIPGLVESFTGKTTPTSFVLGLSGLVAIPLLIALYLNQAAHVGRLGRIGYTTNLIGLGLFGAAAYTLDIALIHFSRSVVRHLLGGPAGIALIGSVVVFAAGSALFGASMLRAGIYPRLAAWGYTVVLPVFALGAPLPYSPYKGVLHVLAAAVLIRLALALPRGSEQPPGPRPLAHPAQLGSGSGTAAAQGEL